jgi:hypothetical protein
MRDAKRIDKVIADLRVAWHANPDWRLGQLILNASRDANGMIRDPWNVEDDAWSAALRKIADPS